MYLVFHNLISFVLSVFITDLLITFSTAYIRSHSKVQEKNIEDQISFTLKGARFKKGDVQAAKTVDVKL